jgi:plastocyanin
VFAAPVAAVIVLGLAGGASARTTRIVVAGPPSNAKQVASHYVSKTFAAKFSPDINAFFNRRTTIHVGDTVSFRLHGFHTVDLPGASGKDLPFVTPVGPPSLQTDAAGKPFWFSVLPQLGINPALLGRSKGRTYNGTSRIDSGAGSSKPLNVKFTKPGVYKFFCDVHPGMVGYVVVRAKHKRIPSRRQAAASELAQLTTAIKQAVTLAKSKPAKDTVSLGEGGSSGVELYAMFPSTLRIKHGTTVTFQMSTSSREHHTATFGPAPYLAPIANSFHSVAFSPKGTYPSDPSQPLTESPSSHGNGFANTGFLDRDPTTSIGPSSQIDFTTPGTYQYECLLHPWMHGTIIVK